METQTKGKYDVGQYLNSQYHVRTKKKCQRKLK